MIGRLKSWIKKNRSEFYILLFILIISSIVRLYKIDEYMTFLGDEGRDAIIVRRLLVNFDPILIGPGTSIGNMYLGPLYYYLSAPFLFLANFSPVGPSVMVAVFGIATVFLIWFSARSWFGKKASVVSSLLYALSPIIIIYSRSSWNPNIMPFFSLLTVFSLWKVWYEGNYKWLTVLGIAFAFAMQSHYLGLLLFPTILLFLILKLRTLYKTDGLHNNSVVQDLVNERKIFIKNLIFGVVLFALLMSPLLIFDIRHNWINFSAIKTFFTKRETTLSVLPWKSIPNILPIIRDDISTRIISGTGVFVGKISTYFVISAFILYTLFNMMKLKEALLEVSSNKSGKGFVLLTVWLLVGLVGLGLYKQHVYDHYFGFMFPAIFLFIGSIYQSIHDMHFDGLKIIVTAWIIALIGSYIVYTPLRNRPNFQMKRAQEVAKTIAVDAGSEKFNLAVVAVQNYEDGYQYFLEENGSKVTDIDALKLSETVGKSLYVVCELSEEKCDPVNSPKAEVANFGWSKIDNKWSVLGVTIFKLIHAK